MTEMERMERRMNAVWEKRFEELQRTQDQSAAVHARELAASEDENKTLKRTHEERDRASAQQLRDQANEIAGFRQAQQLREEEEAEEQLVQEMQQARLAAGTEPPQQQPRQQQVAEAVANFRVKADEQWATVTNGSYYTDWRHGLPEPYLTKVFQVLQHDQPQNPVIVYGREREAGLHSLCLFFLLVKWGPEPGAILYTRKHLSHFSCVFIQTSTVLSPKLLVDAPTKHPEVACVELSWKRVARPSP